MLNEILAQTDKAARLLEIVQRAVENVRGLRSGDRVWTPLVSFAEFSQGDAPSANLIFNVPADADFWAYRLTIYPYCKVVDPENGSPDEIVYRSTSFTANEGPGNLDPSDHYLDIANLVDGSFAFIYEGNEMQNIDTPIAAASCINVLKWTAPISNQGAVWNAVTDTPGGLLFDVPFFIARSKSLVLRVTPSYLGVRTIQEEVPGDGALGPILVSAGAGDPPTVTAAEPTTVAELIATTGEEAGPSPIVLNLVFDAAPLVIAIPEGLTIGEVTVGGVVTPMVLSTAGDFNANNPIDVNGVSTSVYVSANLDTDDETAEVIITFTVTPKVITRQHKYKIVAVLEGEKKAYAFR